MEGPVLSVEVSGDSYLQNKVTTVSHLTEDIEIHLKSLSEMLVFDLLIY